MKGIISVERRERVVLENMCMIRDESKVLVEDKIGKDVLKRKKYKR